MGLLHLVVAVACLMTCSCSANHWHISSILLHTPTVILQQVDFEASIELLELKNGACV